MMRFCFIASLLLAVMACNTPKTTVSIHVDGAQPNTKVALSTKDSTYSVALDSTGTAVVTLAENLKADYARVNYGRMSVPVYLEPGKSFDVTLKFEGRRMTPLFQGEGAKKNEYLNGDAFSTLRPDFKADEATFLASLEESEKQLNASLDSLAFDGLFVQQEKNRIHYTVYGMLGSYPSYHAYYAKDEDYKPSDHFYEVLKTAIPEKEELINMPEYMRAFGNMLNVNASKDGESSLGFIKNYFAYIQNNVKSPALAEHFVHQMACEYVDNYGVDNLDVVEPIYKAKVTSAKKKTEFEQLCGEWAKLTKGQPSPTFKYLDIKGNEVSLADLAGKYVYIDVWATWCGPCRGELPHLQDLEHQFKNKNIHFVSISCDQDKAAWEKMVKDEKLGGIQLHAGQDRDFMNVYKINGIPRFILLDREGKIINANMSRPSEPETVTTLNGLEAI